MGPIPAIINLSIYMMAVCGLWMLVKKQRSFDFWFPAGMSVYLPVLILLCSAGLSWTPGQFADSRLETIATLALLFSVPYGIGLFVLITRSAASRGFSLKMLVFCFGCWLWWVSCTGFWWVATSGAML